MAVMISTSHITGAVPINTHGHASYHCHGNRMLVRAVMMSSSDLSSNALPWDNHYNKVLSLLEEFYKQVLPNADSAIHYTVVV